MQEAPSLPVERGPADLEPPDDYYQGIHDDFHRLDISGVDSDKAFDIPLSDIYVRLRVMFEEGDDQGDTPDAGTLIDIQTALKNYRKLAIVGDPGSGKSTFLKYIALMIARSILEADTKIAAETLEFEPPLPIPVFVSCWDLSDLLRERNRPDMDGLLAFLGDRAAALGFSLDTERMKDLLSTGNCCLLFDGLDGVPTDRGRAVVSRLLEKVVSKFGGNRFVVTSRVRAYTGDTILRGGFARCDIQAFSETDRRLFLGNWVRLLFRVPKGEKMPVQGGALGEFEKLTSAIEKSDRIRELAVNPLLLTVIAIVHWNRKRLPEQRVDLYDECVDVLLGQRKQAERSRYMRSDDVLDEPAEEDTHHERSWIRKRFAEIALLILRSDEEEVTKKEVIDLLRPRFKNLGAEDEDRAESQAERFLDLQELRSGLLVSRRASNYRFVHLTFEEYLAAWHLSNQPFEDTVRIIEPHLREQKWFETLQLLAGEWAKQSDEKLDGYVCWLLERAGRGIAAQAPIVALCANAVRDTVGVAELKPETRSSYEEALRNTLNAFKPDSKVSNKIQLEILDALGKLGEAVKLHLIAATKSRNYDVRKRAIEMVVPHLRDDDLFRMVHIFEDRSRNTIGAYLMALIERDPNRTIEIIRNKNKIPWKMMIALVHIILKYSELDKIREEIIGHILACYEIKGSKFDDV